MTPLQAQFDFHISRLHARTLITLLIAGGAAMAISAANRIWFENSLPVNEAKVASARERIDPNTATAASLDRLPGVGPTRAEAIVQYRRSHGLAAFRTARDLEHIQGIGEGTARKIAPYLTLPCGM